MKRIRHSCATIYHCYNCKKNFKCKRENTKQEKQKREEEYKKTKNVPQCNLCNGNHWRCLSIKCTMCCKLNRCNDIVCINCVENNIECKRTFPRSNEEFENLYNNLSYFSGKFERSETGRLHAQIFFQIKNRVTLKKIKEIFDDNSISLPNYLAMDSDHNRNYSIKKFYRCKQHKNCKCDYMNIEGICELCDESCTRKSAMLSGSIYDVGVWDFGEYCYLDAYTYDKSEIDEINEIRLNDLKKINLPNYKTDDYSIIAFEEKKFLILNNQPRNFSKEKIKIDFIISNNNFKDFNKIKQHFKFEKLIIHSKNIQDNSSFHNLASNNAFEIQF